MDASEKLYKMHQEKCHGLAADPKVKRVGLPKRQPVNTAKRKHQMISDYY
jgi:hypothetical protein